MNAVSCYCSLGHRHDSRGEARYCDEVQLRIKTGEIEVEYQKTFPLDLVHPITGRKVHITNHRPDFVITDTKTGKQWVEEYKGCRTAEWRMKRSLWPVCYPEIEYKTINHREPRKQWKAQDVRRVNSGKRNG